MPETIENGEPKKPLTRGELVAADIAALIKARNSLIWLKTNEEARAERLIFRACAKRGYICHTWDVAAGVCNMAGEPETGVGSADVRDTFAMILQRALSPAPNKDVWVLRDLPSVIPPGFAGAIETRTLRNLARTLPTTPTSTIQAIVVITPSGEVPPELAGHATVIEFPLPDRAEIAAILDIAVEDRPDAQPNGNRDAAIDAAVGLSGEEASACYARSLVQLGRIDPKIVAGEKKRIVAREGVLEWFDPLPGGLDAVGGLDLLKTWLLSRAAAWSPRARAYGLPAPKGALFAGISGCGKSLMAKAIATAWGVPLLRVDLGALKSKYVGESESNLRKAFSVIEALGRCVVWFDEIEKALQGASSGSADGGVSSDALGAILSWMQDRKGEAFVVATCNKVNDLPPELLRKGRFDEVWGINLPTQSERVAILQASLRQYGRGAVKIDAVAIAKACVDYTGSEVANLVPDALYTAFADNEREIETRDLFLASKGVVPLIKTKPEDIQSIQAWLAQGRARLATSPEVVTPTTRTSGRRIDA